MTIAVILSAGVLALGSWAAQPDPKPAPAPTAPAPAAPAAPVGPPTTKENGLVIEDLVIGKGPDIKKGDVIACHYVGTLKADGKVFETTRQPEKMAGFALRAGPGVAPPGWLEGIPGMKVGGKRRLTVPAAIAFGETGRPATRTHPVAIPPKSDLVYEVEVADKMVIEDLTVGTGVECKHNTVVFAHYKGTLKSDGTKFDSSYDHNEPIPFALTAVVKGWTEGLPGMKTGGKRKLIVPYALAYGERGRPSIPAKADLVFEIELLETADSLNFGIEDLVVGTGEECKPNQVVTFFYKGTFKDGKPFESNFGKEPAVYPLGQLIPGWQYGIPGMKVGGKRKLTIPWQFAYGAAGSPPDIPPKADLVFEIELVGVRDR